MNPFGASNNLSDSTNTGLKNEFNTIADNDIDSVLSSNRVEPRQVATGVTRGTWRINNTDGSYITIGLIPNSTDFGMAFFDKNNRLISSTIGVTDFKYDANGINYYQNGLLPDGSYGAVYAKPGVNVSEVF